MLVKNMCFRNNALFLLESYLGSLTILAFYFNVILAYCFFVKKQWVE